LEVLYSTVSVEDAEFGFGCNLFTAAENIFEAPETVGYLLEVEEISSSRLGRDEYLRPR
jgi:hypothetical protein